MSVLKQEFSGYFSLKLEPSITDTQIYLLFLQLWLLAKESANKNHWVLKII